MKNVNEKAAMMMTAGFLALCAVFLFLFLGGLR